MVNVKGREIRFRFFGPGAAAMRLVYEPSGVNGILRMAEDTQEALSCGRSSLPEAQSRWTPRTRSPGPNRHGGRFTAAASYESCYEKSAA